MSKTKEKQPLFDLSGGHPVLDFVNSLDKRFHEGGPVELLVDYADLLRFTEQTNLLDTRQVRRLANSVNAGAAARTLRSARELREALATAFYGSVDSHPPLPTDIRTLERHFHSAGEHRELRWEQPVENANGRSGLGWDWGRFETNADLPVLFQSQTASQHLNPW